MQSRVRGSIKPPRTLTDGPTAIVAVRGAPGCHRSRHPRRSLFPAPSRVRAYHSTPERAAPRLSAWPHPVLSQFALRMDAHLTIQAFALWVGEGRAGSLFRGRRTRQPGGDRPRALRAATSANGREGICRWSRAIGTRQGAKAHMLGPKTCTHSSIGIAPRSTRQLLSLKAKMSTLPVSSELRAE